MREEEWKFVSQAVNDGRDIQTECAIILRKHPLEFEVCEGHVRCGFRQFSSIAKIDKAVPVAPYLYRYTMSVLMHYERSPICIVNCTNRVLPHVF